MPYLNAMVVGIGNDDVLLNSQTEAVRRVELVLGWTESAELEANLHWLRCLGAVTSTERNCVSKHT